MRKLQLLSILANTHFGFHCESCFLIVCFSFCLLVCFFFGVWFWIFICIGHSMRWVVPHCDSICIFLITLSIFYELFFAIHTTSLVKCLFKFFACFILNCLFSFHWVRNFIYSGNKSLNRYVIYKYFLSVIFSFILPTVSFTEQIYVPNFHLFYKLCLLCYI